MKMVRHNDVCAQRNRREFVPQFQPPFFDHLAGGVQSYLPIYDLPKQTFASLRNDGDVICTLGCVIVPLQANASTTVFIRIVFHDDFVAGGTYWVPPPWLLLCLNTE